MPAAFDACVNAGGRVRTKKLGDGKYMHICFKGGKSYAGEVKSKETLRWTSNFILEGTEITEDAHGHKGRKIKGTLLKATESKNGRVYELDGIIKAKHSSELPMPISMNHTDDVTDNVGKITSLISTGDGLDYEGFVYNTAKHPGAIEMMENGLINKISIEADNPLVENKGDKVIVKEFQLMGAGFVKYAGIPQASASIAEALEQNLDEVKDMEIEQLEKQLEEKEKALTEANKLIEAHQKEFEKNKLSEAEKMRFEKEAEHKALVESVAKLQEEVKTLKETKKSGIITGDNSASEYQIVEQLETHNHAPKTFVFQTYSKEGRTFKEFFPVNPQEFY